MAPESLCSSSTLPAEMDQLDEAIFRTLVAGRHPLLGGVDPRLSAMELGRKIGVDRTTVWSRLRRWQRTGFYEGFEVIPNPHLFGARLGTASLRAESARARPTVVRDLSQVENAVAAVDQAGPWIVAWVAFESPQDLRDLSVRLRMLPGVAEATPCRPLWSVPTGASPTRLDWKIIQELRASPRLSLTQVAARLRISSRTVTRRYHRLIDGSAVWFVPRFNFERSGRTFTMVNAFLAPKADAREVGRHLASLVPGHIVTFDGSEWAPEPPPPLVVSFGLLESAAQAAQTEESVSALAGVTEVESFFLRRAHFFPDWFDARVALALSPRSVKRNGPRQTD
jgi:DNA-binding Lrp family transcriptional regulator